MQTVRWCSWEAKIVTWEERSAHMRTGSWTKGHQEPTDDVPPTKYRYRSEVIFF